MNSLKTPSFSFIVPALNEAENLPAVVEEIMSNTLIGGVHDYEIIIIDDGSADDTYLMAERLREKYGNILVLRNESRIGVGRSFLRGAEAAKKNCCLIVPGDNEFDLSFFPQAAAMLSKGRSDFIVTYMENPWSRPFHRRLLSRLYINIFNLLFSTDFKYTNGIVIYPSKWIGSIKLESKGYTFQSEALLKAYREGKRFAYMGMKIRQRAHGKSKIFSMKAIFEILYSLFRMRFRISG